MLTINKRFSDRKLYLYGGTAIVVGAVCMATLVMSSRPLHERAAVLSSTKSADKSEQVVSAQPEEKQSTDETPSVASGNSRPLSSVPVQHTSQEPLPSPPALTTSAASLPEVSPSPDATPSLIPSESSAPMSSEQPADPTNPTNPTE